MLLTYSLGTAEEVQRKHKKKSTRGKIVESLCKSFFTIAFAQNACQCVHEHQY